MKKLTEILKNYKDYETPLDDRFGKRLCDFLTVKQAKELGFTFVEGYVHKKKAWTEKNVLAQLERDVAFGFEKALDRRGISAGLMNAVVQSWCKVLDNGIDPSKYPYPMYGLPLLKAVAVKYGFDNPIGDDEGTEDKYSDGYGCGE